MSNYININAVKDAFATMDLKVSKEYAYGMYEGYFFTMAIRSYNNNSKIEKVLEIYIPLSDTNMSDKARINILSAFNGDFNKNTLIIRMKMEGNIKKFNTDATELCCNLIRLLKENGLSCGCTECSCENPNFTVISSDMPIPILVCRDCETALFQKVYEINEAKKNAPNNYIKGVLGSILGAVLGALIWIGISYLGYVSNISALAVIFGTYLGYKLCKGKFTNLSFVIISVIHLAAMTAACYLSFAIDLYKVIKDIYYLPGFYYFLSDIMPKALEDPDIKSAFLSHSRYGIIFAVIGVAVIIGLIISEKKPAEVKRL